MKQMRSHTDLLRACLAAGALLVLGTSAAIAATTRVELPAGYDLTATEGVASSHGRHALAIWEDGVHVASRVMQVAADSETVFTDVEGVADWVEYSADASHLLVRQSLPHDDPRQPARLYSVIDNAGQVVWSSASTAAYRFTAGGNHLYVALFPGSKPEIRVYDLQGRLVRAVRPSRPYLDARVLDAGDEALVLFSTPRSRSTDTRGGREVSVARMRLNDERTVLWNVPLNQDTLKYPELIPVDQDWILITTQHGFVAVHRDGQTTRSGPDVDLHRLMPAAGDRPGQLILYHPDGGKVMDLAGGRSRELATSAAARFDNVQYRDGQVVLALPGEVLLRPVGDPAEEPVAVEPVQRKRPQAAKTKLGGRQR